LCKKNGSFIRIDSEIKKNGNLNIVKGCLKYITITKDEITVHDFEILEDFQKG